MSSVNKAIILGNLGKDPELKYMSNGKAVVNVSIATSQNWKDKNSGEKKQKTEWHRVVAYDKLAEIIGKYCKKGSTVYIEGRIETRKWEKDGENHYTTEIIAETMQMIGSRGDVDNASDDDPAANKKPARSATQTRSMNDMDDDIPF